MKNKQITNQDKIKSLMKKKKEKLDKKLSIEREEIFKKGKTNQEKIENLMKLRGKRLAGIKKNDKERKENTKNLKKSIKKKVKKGIKERLLSIVKKIIWLKKVV